MKNARFIWTLLPLALCCTAVQAQEKAAKPLPKLELVGPQTVELGTLPAYAVKEVAFTVKNAGKGPGTLVNIVSTCPCVSAAADKTALPPGESAVITLRLDASKVHDTFRRGVWLETDDPENTRLLLAVSGVVKPLFKGLPPMPVLLSSAGASCVWTNTYEVAATETNLFLGAPVIATNGEIRVEVAIATNKAQGLTEYTIRTMLTPLGSGKAAATVGIPVEGRADLTLRPLSLVYQSTAGAALRVAPSKLLITPGSRAMNRTVRISTSERAARPEALTWSPNIEGVTIKAESFMLKSSINVTISLTPESIEKLLQAKQTKITFSYPDHKPVVLELSDSQGVRGTALPSMMPLKNF